jgi:hypothetical protein
MDQKGLSDDGRQTSTEIAKPSRTKHAIRPLDRKSRGFIGDRSRSRHRMSLVFIHLSSASTASHARSAWREAPNREHWNFSGNSRRISLLTIALGSGQAK